MTKEQAIGGGVVVLGSGATVGGILSSQGSESEVVAELVLLVHENNFSSNYEADTVGKKYGWYLISAHGKTSENVKDSSKNKEWWSLRYSVLRIHSKDFRSKLSNEFKNEDDIKSAFSYSTDSSDDKALNKVCERIYKKQANTVEFKFTTDSEQSRLGDDLLTYCSPLASIPKTINRTSDANSYTSGTWGDTYKDKLVSINDYEAQTNFWPFRDAEFFGKENSDGTGAELKEIDDKLFYDLYAKKKSNKTEEDTVVKTCEKVYRSAKTGNEIKIKEETLFKFCSWDYKEES